MKSDQGHLKIGCELWEKLHLLPLLFPCGHLGRETPADITYL